MFLNQDSSRRKKQIPKVRHNELKDDVMNDREKQVCFFSFKKTELEKEKEISKRLYNKVMIQIGRI